MLLSFWPFETVQKRQSIAIEVQYCAYLSTTSYGRQELHTLKLNFARFGKSFGAALVNRDPESAPNEPLPYSFQF